MAFGTHAQLKMASSGAEKSISSTLGRKSIPSPWNKKSPFRALVRVGPELSLDRNLPSFS